MNNVAGSRHSKPNDIYTAIPRQTLFIPFFLECLPFHILNEYYSILLQTSRHLTSFAYLRWDGVYIVWDETMKVRSFCDLDFTCCDLAEKHIESNVQQIECYVYYDTYIF
jgi:hypothetical protein